ncbi:MAG: protein phosphatase 2C domain-containing protein [Rhodospirillales bacterium]
MPFKVWASTHNGTVRKHNEDTFVSRPDIGLWAVADGAGGHDAGEVASGMLADALSEIPPALSGVELLNTVRERVADVHAALLAEASQRGSGSVIASTLVVLMVRGGHFASLWAGDSRAYLLRGGVMQQVTRDHSLTQELVDAGAITAEQAEHHPQANVITRAVGGGDDVLELDKVTGALEAGDRFLLCSDGLSKELDEATLATLLAADAGEGPAEALIAAAVTHGARDNVTALVVDVRDVTGAALA